MPFIRYFLDETPWVSDLERRMDALYRLYFNTPRKCASKTLKENLTGWLDVDYGSGLKVRPWRGEA